MPLRLEYPDKYRLWSDLIQGNTDRVFVATDSPPGIGALVPVELALSGLPVSIIIHGTVVGLRRKSERFRAGAYVRFADEEIEKCRKFLGLTQSPEKYAQGRKAKRVSCDLKVVFKHPPMAEHGVARNLSENGILLTCPQELYLGQYVELELHLDDGPLGLRGEVTRDGNGVRLAGVRFLDLPEEARRRISDAVTRLTPPEGSRQLAIVIADDDPIILEFLSKALTQYGYVVHKARRGEDAIALVRELKPKLVLLDILMPGIDGVDICKMMRADVDLADIPVIFLSALDPERLHQVADEAGATDYMVKPVALADLINMVGAYLKA